MSASLISIQVGLPRIVTHDGQQIETGIVKAPILGRVNLRQFNLDGDRQADLSVHGGRDKTVYAYPSEHYPYWKKELPGIELPWGSFGENFTTSGLLENTVCIGDRFTVGTAELVVTQPRLPCYKLNAKFDRDDMVKRFLASHHSGFYFRVLREGEVGAGDEIILTHPDKNRVSVLDAFILYIYGSDKPELRERALQVEYLSDSWRRELSEQV